MSDHKTQTDFLRGHIAGLSEVASALYEVEKNARTSRMSVERMIANLGGELADIVFPKGRPRLAVDDMGKVVAIDQRPPTSRPPVPPQASEHLQEYLNSEMEFDDGA